MWESDVWCEVIWIGVVAVFGWRSTRCRASCAQLGHSGMRPMRSRLVPFPLAPFGSAGPAMRKNGSQKRQTRASKDAAAPGPPVNDSGTAAARGTWPLSHAHQAAKPRKEVDGPASAGRQRRATTPTAKAVYTPETVAHEVAEASKVIGCTRGCSLVRAWFLVACPRERESTCTSSSFPPLSSCFQLSRERNVATAGAGLRLSLPSTRLLRCCQPFQPSPHRLPRKASVDLFVGLTGLGSLFLGEEGREGYVSLLWP